MSRQDERRPMLSDEAIRRALRPGTDIGAPADFAARVGAAIAGRPQQRRFWQVAAGPSSRQLVIVGQLLLLLALLLALVIGAFIVGSPRRAHWRRSPARRAVERTLVDRSTITHLDAVNR